MMDVRKNQQGGHSVSVYGEHSIHVWTSEGDGFPKTINAVIELVRTAGGHVEIHPQGVDVAAFIDATRLLMDMVTCATKPPLGQIQEVAEAVAAAEDA